MRANTAARFVWTLELYVCLREVQRVVRVSQVEFLALFKMRHTRLIVSCGEIQFAESEVRQWIRRRQF